MNDSDTRVHSMIVYPAIRLAVTNSCINSILRVRLSLYTHVQLRLLIHHKIVFLLSANRVDSVCGMSLPALTIIVYYHYSITGLHDVVFSYLAGLRLLHLHNEVQQRI